MRIALLAHCHHPIAEPFRGGLEMHTALLADELVGRGHEVTLFAKGGSRTRARLHAVLPVEHVHGPAVPGRPDPDTVLETAMRTAVAGIGTEVDVVLNNSLGPVPYTDLDHRPVFTVLHTPATLARVNAVVRRPGWRASPRHAWAGVSELTSRDWRRLLPRVTVIPNGIDLAHWRPRPGTVRQPRRAVWSGRITPEKGLVLAIEAARLAGWRLDIAGPVSDQRYFDAEVAPRLDDRIRYRGHLTHDELPAFLQAGTVYLFTPRWEEPFGLALVEALAGGTPAAALPVGAVPEIIRTAGGVLAATSTPEALARALDEAARLDRGPVAGTVARFDKRVMVDAYEAVLARLVAAVPRPRLDLDRPPRDLADA